MAGPDELEAWLDGWDPAPEVVDDPLDPAPNAALAAVLDEAPPTSPWLPPLRHWVHFVGWPRTDALDADGHPSSGALVPPLPGRTRMFVGGHLEVGTGLRTGLPARRHSTVTARQVKAGRSGAMVFVTVRHEIHQAGATALVDEQQLMYRAGAAPRPADAGATGAPVAGTPAADPPTSDAPWQEPFSAGPALLFRFSALTANSHRIHYDHPYATTVEGYRNLVVHGPLLAVVLARLALRSRPDAVVASMDYRFSRPVLAGDPVLLTGRPEGDGLALAVVAADGQPSASARVTWA